MMSYLILVALLFLSGCGAIDGYTRDIQKDTYASIAQILQEELKNISPRKEVLIDFITLFWSNKTNKNEIEKHLHTISNRELIKIAKTTSNTIYLMGRYNIHFNLGD